MGAQGERGKTGDHGQTGERGPQGPRGPRASTFVTRNLVLLFLLITLGNVLSFVAMSLGFHGVDQERQRQAERLCLVAKENRADNNTQNDAMRNILVAAARTSGSDPARLEMLLRSVPVNRPEVECDHGTTPVTTPP